MQNSKSRDFGGERAMLPTANIVPNRTVLFKRITTLTQVIAARLK